MARVTVVNDNSEFLALGRTSSRMIGTRRPQSTAIGPTHLTWCEPPGRTCRWSTCGWARTGCTDGHRPAGGRGPTFDGLPVLICSADVLAL